MAPLALVTGASSGIGRASAQHLTGLGFHVLAGVGDESDAPPGLEPVRLDVTSASDIAAVSERVGAELGLPDRAFDALIRRALTSGDR